MKYSRLRPKNMKLTLSVELPSKLNKRAKLFGLFLIILCIGFTIYLTNVFLQANRRAVTNEMETTVNQVVDTFRKRIEAYTDVLYAGRAIFLVDPEVSQEKWQDYVDNQNIVDRYPGLSSIIYAENSQGGSTVSLAAPETVQYLVNTPITSEAVKQAMVTASITGQPVASTPFLRQKRNDGEERVSMILAIYNSTYSPAMSDEEKVRATRGYVLTTIKPQSIFTEAVKSVASTAPVNLTVKDQDERLIYDHIVVYMSDLRQATGKKTLDVGGRIWQISYAVPSDYKLTFTEKYTPSIVIIGGTVFMIMLVTLYFYRKGLAISIRRSERFAITKQRRPRE